MTVEDEIDLKELENFLHEAHTETYANKNAPKAPSTRLKSVDYSFGGRYQVPFFLGGGWYAFIAKLASI